MRIAHVVHSYFPRIGGIERAVQHLAEEQVKLGHEVTVITSNVDVVGSPKEEMVNGVNVVRLRSSKLLYNDLTIPREGPPVKGVDIIHTHSQNSLFSITVAEKLKERVRASVAFHFMAVDAFRDHPNFFVRLFAPYYGKWNTRRALKVADLPLVRSIRDLEILREKYGVEAEYLPDAVPDYYFTAEKADPSEFRERFGIKQERFFLFIGRMHKLKGPHVLARALKYVEEDIAAVFIGPDGGYLKETLDLAEKLGVRDRVYVLGYVDEKTKMQALDSAIALVLPSIADYVEVYPMVISEAWARERPVIASRISGILLQGQTGC
jgi:glycosyltransferase involved in cell wall biosynthesis